MPETGQLTIDLLLTPDASASILISIHDVLASLAMAELYEETGRQVPPFRVRIVSETGMPCMTASGIEVAPHSKLGEGDAPDIVILPAMVASLGRWQTGRYPAIVDWLKHLHKRGTKLYSACSGVLLLAETGLLDGEEVTLHWTYARLFEKLFPRTRPALEKALVIAGRNREFVMSGASASWHDLVLHLIAKYRAPTTAQTMAKLFALQWHHEGQLPYMVFDPRTDHDDAAVLEAQRWLADNYTIDSPVEQLVGRSGMPARTFKRRFTQATGLSPIAYVQALRIGEAKRYLERTETPVDEIGWRVGYEDPAFFRRLFKRETNMTPGAYRRKFMVPPR